MLNQAKYFSRYWVKKDKVVYTSPFEADLFEKQEDHFTDLMEIGLFLVKNVQEWEFPK